MDVGSPLWYGLILLVGLVTGALIAWFRRER
jgi:prolipoprotein diacylglyceryltransferase